MPGGMCPLNDSSKRIIDKTTDSSLAGQRSTFPNLEVKNDSESIFRQLYATPEMRPLGRHSLNLEPQVVDVIIADGEGSMLADIRKKTSSCYPEWQRSRSASQLASHRSLVFV